MSSKGRLAIVAAVSLCAAAVLWLASSGRSASTTFTYSEFLDQVRNARVASAIVIGSNSGANEASYRLKDGSPARTVLPSDYRDALLAMQENLVNIEIRAADSSPGRLLRNASPFLILLAVWAVLMIRGIPHGLLPS